MCESVGDVDVCEMNCDPCVVHESSRISMSHESHVSLSENDEKRKKRNETDRDGDDVAWVICGVWRNDGGAVCHNGQEMATACLQTYAVCFSVS